MQALIERKDDSLSELIRDMDNAAAAGACHYYYSDPSATHCMGCPAEEAESCEKTVVEDIARRLHALMPHDAKGVEIKPGDTIENPAKEQERITDILAFPAIVESDGMGVTTFSLPYLWRVTEPDSWERLEEDCAEHRCCDYFHYGHGLDTCDGCPAFKSDGECFHARAADIVRRAKALAGVE